MKRKIAIILSLVVSACLLAGLGVGTQAFADYVPIGYWAADAVSLPDAWELAGCIV